MRNPYACTELAGKSYKSSCESPAVGLLCEKYQRTILDRALRNACDSDSRCGLACDASARNAKSPMTGKVDFGFRYRPEFIGTGHFCSPLHGLFRKRGGTGTGIHLPE